jgi:hypothetical protein
MVHIKPPRCHHWRLNLFPSHSTQSWIRALKKSVLSVCSLEVKACFTSESIANSLPSRCFLRGTKDGNHGARDRDRRKEGSMTSQPQTRNSRKTDWRRRLGCYRSKWRHHGASLRRRKACTTIALCSYCGPMSKEVHKKRIYIIPKDSCFILPYLWRGFKFLSLGGLWVLYFFFFQMSHK